MFKLLKDGTCYTPDNVGKKDVLVACGIICRISDEIPVEGLWELEVFDCNKKLSVRDLLTSMSILRAEAVRKGLSAEYRRLCQAIC